MKLNLFVLWLLGLFLNACANEIYKEVLIPTKCDIPARTRPAFNKSELIESIKNLLIYTESLENDLSFCRGEKSQNTQGSDK